MVGHSQLFTAPPSSWYYRMWLIVNCTMWFSASSTESVDWENDPDSLASSAWDLPLGGGGKERSGEELFILYIAHKLTHTHFFPLFSRLWVNMCISVQVEVSPLENAIYVVENKTQELRTLISQYQHRQHHGNINPLSMCLNGVIDAAVNGGIARYQEVLWQGKGREGGGESFRNDESVIVILWLTLFFTRRSLTKTTSAVTQRTRRGSHIWRIWCKSRSDSAFHIHDTTNLWFDRLTW